MAGTTEDYPGRQSWVILDRTQMPTGDLQTNPILFDHNAVNSALQRARETLAKRYPGGRLPAASRPDLTQQELLGRYEAAPTVWLFRPSHSFELFRSIYDFGNRSCGLFVVVPTSGWPIRPCAQPRTRWEPMPRRYRSYFFSWQPQKRQTLD
jgi:hypothetical protein